MDTKLQELYEDLNVTYFMYTQELQKVYGRGARDAIYDRALNRATPKLAMLYDEHSIASQAYSNYVADMRSKL